MILPRGAGQPKSGNKTVADDEHGRGSAQQVEDERGERVSGGGTAAFTIWQDTTLLTS
jgi:hypothetical protein